MSKGKHAVVFTDAQRSVVLSALGYWQTMLEDRDFDGEKVGTEMRVFNAAYEKVARS